MRIYSYTKTIKIATEPEEAFLAGSVTTQTILVEDNVEVKSFEDEGTFEVSFE